MNLPGPKWVICIVVLLVFLVMMVGRKQKNLHKLSPKQALSLFYKAQNKSDVELIKKLIYFPPGTTEEQKLAEAKSNSIGPNANLLIKLAASGRKAKYGKIIDENTAEVGIVSCAGFLGFGQKNPVAKVILKRDDNIWKYFGYKYDLPNEQLFEKLKDNPEDADLYYYYGFHTMSENPAKANRFFKKYYELEPDGFWVTDHFVKKLQKYDNKDDFENHMLKLLPNAHGNMSDMCLILGQCFLEYEDFEKAKYYFQKTEEAIKKYPAPIVTERLLKSKQELQLRMDGEYYDILTELEARENADN